MSNVLPDAFIALLVYGLLQLFKSVVPKSALWPNNVLRAMGYALTYALVVVNRIVLGPVHWPDLWGLLPLAAALYGGSALLYHVNDARTQARAGNATATPSDAHTAPRAGAGAGPSVVFGASAVPPASADALQAEPPDAPS